MSLETIYQSQISTFDSEIQGYSGIMAQIVTEGVTGNELADCLQDDYDQVMRNYNHLITLKESVEQKLARLQAGWTGQHQTYVNDIESGYTGVYTRELQRWLGEDLTEKYTPFFTMYGQATNDFQKQRLLKMTFGR